MSLFQDALDDEPYAKFGFFGDAGSGKSWTASLIASGLYQYAKATKPVYFIDTEKGATFVKKEIFDKAGIPLRVLKSRAFKDLKPAIEEAEKEASVLIIDSITHPWYEITSSYLRTKRDGTKFIRIQDWQPIKDTWRAGYSEPYVNAQVHIIMCGRSANIFRDVEDVEQTNIQGKEVFKPIQIGTKMRTESETGYEPNLLCEMAKTYLQERGKYVRRCTIIKDRFAILDSCEFDNPTFESFLPHIERLSLGKTGGVIDTKRVSDDLFNSDDSRNLSRMRHQREILLEEIEGVLVAAYPGRSSEEVKKKADFIQKAFGGYSWKALADLDPKSLKLGLEEVRALITKDLASQGVKGEKGKN